MERQVAKVTRYGLPVLGAVLLASGAYLGLSWVPVERHMGNVARIMYVHVPSVWMMLLCGALNFGASLWYLLKGASWRADALAEAGAENSLAFGAIAVVLGSIWARPTWGLFWTWDPRNISVTVMLATFAGYLALRRLVKDPEARARRAAVLGVLASANLGLVWFSVRWFNNLHQMPSTAATTYPELRLALGWNALGFLLIAIWFVRQRFELAMLGQASRSASSTG